MREMEHLMDWELAVEIEVIEENKLQRHYFHHEILPENESGPPWWGAGD
jgi:hypothetical protein